MHLLHPVAETVDDQPADDGMVGVERVAAAGVVGVPRVLPFEHVVGAVAEPAETDRRAALIALRGVVEHDVEDDLEPGPVERLHHVAELVDRPERILPRAERRVGREERHRRVAPVVDVSGRAVERVELEDRQQLDGGHAEILQVRDLLDDPGIGAAGVFGQARARMPGEAAHVHLVDDRL